MILEGTGGGNMGLDSLFGFFIAIIFGPALILAIIGLVLLIKKKKKAALIFFILAVVYVIVSLGVCRSM